MGYMGAYLGVGTCPGHYSVKFCTYVPHLMVDEHYAAEGRQ